MDIKSPEELSNYGLIVLINSYYFTPDVGHIDITPYLREARSRGSIKLTELSQLEYRKDIHLAATRPVQIRWVRHSPTPCTMVVGMWVGGDFITRNYSDENVIAEERFR